MNNNNPPFLDTQFRGNCLLCTSCNSRIIIFSRFTLIDSGETSLLCCLYSNSIVFEKIHKATCLRKDEVQSGIVSCQLKGQFHTWERFHLRELPKQPIISFHYHDISLQRTFSNYPIIYSKPSLQRSRTLDNAYNTDNSKAIKKEENQVL